MNVLFVDHACHLKTKSADFFLEILRREHTVETHYYERAYRCNIPAEKVAAADLVVFWEFLPDRYRIAIPGKPCLFVPMYDNEWGSKWQWMRIAKSGMAVLSFCDAVTRHAKACGIENILTVHYALDPAQFKDEGGDMRQAIYWDRGNFTEKQIRALFVPDAIGQLTVQRDFLPSDQYADFIKRFGVYVAPRRKEGIGMAFLEQLARGKCVVAHDDATMNEYIEDGKTGILRNFDAPSAPITRENIAAVQGNVKSAAQTYYQRWMKEREEVNPFVAAIAQTPCTYSVGSFGDMLRYLAFIVEGVLYRLCHS